MPFQPALHKILLDQQTKAIVYSVDSTLTNGSSFEINGRTRPESIDIQLDPLDAFLPVLKPHIEQICYGSSSIESKWVSDQCQFCNVFEFGYVSYQDPVAYVVYLNNRERRHRHVYMLFRPTRDLKEHPQKVQKTHGNAQQHNVNVMNVLFYFSISFECLEQSSISESISTLSCQAIDGRSRPPRRI